MAERSDAGSSWHRVIGIDFGTTSCSVSVWNGSRVTIVPSIDGGGITPSIVGQNAAGRVVVGSQPGGDPETAITGIKRELGAGDGIRFRGRTYQPREVCAYLLLELRRQAEAVIGQPVHDAVIALPAVAAESQRRTLREAAGLAQLNVRRMLDDAVAAAVAFGGDDRVRIYALYDLGGGTFEAAIVRIGPGLVEVLGTAGDTRLGGDDFDARIVEYALRRIRDRHHVDLSSDERIRQVIRREAEIRKRELSEADAATLDLPLLTATVDACVPLHRRTFVQMIAPDVERTLTCLTRALTAATAAHGVGLADIEQVLLVGCSTRIPSIRHRLARYFGLSLDAIRTDLDPGELIARGAGLIAREYEPSALLEGAPLGMLSAAVRLRSEMADPETPAPRPPTLPDGMPSPPAETPADLRPVAERSHRLLTSTPDGHGDDLPAAYRSFVLAVLAAAGDDDLAALGAALTEAYRRRVSPSGDAAGTCP